MSRAQPKKNAGFYTKWYVENLCIPEKHTHDMLAGLTTCMATTWSHIVADDAAKGADADGVGVEG